MPLFLCKMVQELAQIPHVFVTFEFHIERCRGSRAPIIVGVPPTHTMKGKQMTKAYPQIKVTNAGPSLKIVPKVKVQRKQAPLLLQNPIAPKVSPLVLDKPVASEMSETDIRALFRAISADLDFARQPA